MYRSRIFKEVYNGGGGGDTIKASNKGSLGNKQGTDMACQPLPWRGGVEAVGLVAEGVGVPEARIGDRSPSRGPMTTASALHPRLLI